MQDKLDKFIADNKEEFDVYEPSPDLWKKIIDEKADNQFELNPNRNFRFYAMRIAAVLLIAVISIVAYEQITGTDENQEIAADQQERVVDPEIVELMEAEAYYGNQVSLKMKELEDNTAEFVDIREDVLSDFEELDAAYTELVNELGSDIYKQEVIESMIENYRLKISILEEVLNQLDSWKNDNTLEIKGI